MLLVCTSPAAGNESMASVSVRARSKANEYFVMGMRCESSIGSSWHACWAPEDDGRYSENAAALSPIVHQYRS
jgi:hypothetical protein